MDRKSESVRAVCSLSLCLQEPEGTLICVGLDCLSVGKVQVPMEVSWGGRGQILGDATDAIVCLMLRRALTRSTSKEAVLYLVSPCSFIS